MPRELSALVSNSDCGTAAVAWSLKAFDTNGWSSLIAGEFGSSWGNSTVDFQNGEEIHGVSFNWTKEDARTRATYCLCRRVKGAPVSLDSSWARLIGCCEVVKSPFSG